MCIVQAAKWPKVGELKDLTLLRAYGVKLPYLRAVSAGTNVKIVKWIRFFLGPWLLVCQFIEISNQMEVNGDVTNFGWKNLFYTLLHKKFFFEV